MGGCCSKNEVMEGMKKKDCKKIEYEVDEIEENADDDDDNVVVGDDGTRVMLQGFNKWISMFTQQGRKGINQDAMTVWEDFNGEKDVLFCGVFDGHGPSGHLVARHVRDALPSKLLAKLKQSKSTSYNRGNNHEPNEYEDDYHDEDEDEKVDNGSSLTTNNSPNNDKNDNPLFSFWKTSFIDCFKDVDDELGRDSSIDCYCSGTAAVALVKQGNHLIIANLGDSRAILGTRGSRSQLIPTVLTVDLKPNIPSEAERIKNSNGRVFAMEDEPDVYRMWLPHENTPGLAMARAFGDFCLKTYGLISVPEVTYRKLTTEDEFVVLATDGVWDVLTNNEVIKTIASTKKRPLAAKLLVDRAVKGWRIKYPGSKMDDIAVICLFLEHKPPSLNNEVMQYNVHNHDTNDLIVFHSATSSPRRSTQSERGYYSTGNGRSNSLDTKETWNALGGNSRVNSIINLPRFLNWRRTEKDSDHGIEVVC